MLKPGGRCAQDFLAALDVRLVTWAVVGSFLFHGVVQFIHERPPCDIRTVQSRREVYD